MPVIITKNSIEYYLVPAPLVSFSRQTFNNVGRPGFGADYSATLQGTLIPTHGNPYYINGTGAFSTASWTKTIDVEPSEITVIDTSDLLDATIKKQEKIRSLFTNNIVDGVAKPIKVTIKGWDTDYEGSGLVFQAFVDDITFDADSRWVQPGSYSVSLRNATFLNSANSGEFDSYHNETKFIYNISNLTENFDIQEDGQKTLFFNGNNVFQDSRKVYAINRSITVVGSPVYDDDGNYMNGLAPWQHASGYVYAYLGLGSSQLPDTKAKATKFLGLGYNVANTVYQESIDKEAGTYSLTETYIAYSGSGAALETITINQDVSESEINAISIQGTIQGLNTIAGFEISGNAFNNAETYWGGVSSESPVLAYYYARGVLPSGSWLHPRALSRSVGRDFAAGTISYSYSFDDRPPNVIPGSISESVSINDTYPGELFSVTPVIGRSQPVLQYLNSRSEYKRSLSINVTMGKKLPNWNTTLGGADVNISGVLASGAVSGIVQTWMIGQKPSMTNMTEFNLIYQAVNPVNDPNFTVVQGKCFHSAPTESWDRRTGNYTYSIEWTYTRT